MQYKVKLMGFGVVEILVSLLVVAMGIVGMTVLHNRSLQYSYLSYQYSQAVILAVDMLDRLYINRNAALTTSSYQLTVEDNTQAICSHEFYPNTCEIGQCSPAQLALYDTQQWQFQLLCQLPGVTAEISYDEREDGRMYTITILFPENNKGIKPADIVVRGSL